MEGNKGLVFHCSTTLLFIVKVLSHVPPVAVWLWRWMGCHGKNRGSDRIPLIYWRYWRIHLYGIHPGRLTWNLQIIHLERKIDLPNLHDYVPCWSSGVYIHPHFFMRIHQMQLNTPVTLDLMGLLKVNFFIILPVEEVYYSITLSESKILSGAWL